MASMAGVISAALIAPVIDATVQLSAKRSNAAFIESGQKFTCYAVNESPKWGPFIEKNRGRCFNGIR